MHRRCFKLILVLALMSLVLGSSVMPVLGHDYGRGGYDYDQIIEIENPDWMASLSNCRRISELSIPGTHDTMSRCRDASTCQGEIGKWWVKCQSFSLADQLKIGIRALDIRCRHFGDRFAIHHGKSHVDGMWFDTDVLTPVIDFLKDHPGETVLMRIKPESEPSGNKKTFSEVFESYVEETGAPVWHPPEGIDQPNPTLGEVRGKIVILDDFSNGNKYGINWSDDSYVHIQDNFQWKQGFDDMDNKWYDILGHLEKTRTGSMDDIYINFLSGVGDGPDHILSQWPYPWFFASGHMSGLSPEPGTDGGHQTWFWFLGKGECGPYYDCPECGPFYESPERCVFTGMNELILEKWIYNDEVEKTGRIGIIMADFPSDLLADAIINLNPQSIYIDIKPRSCPNPLNVKSRGVLPVAILGTSGFDVTQIDPASIQLLGVAPLRSSLEDVATPSCLACTEMGPDGYMDLILEFETQKIVAALGEVDDGERIVLKVTGNLKDEFGGDAIVGGDVVDILKKGRADKAKSP